MKLALVVVEEAVHFKAEAEYIKDGVEDAYLADVVEVDLVVAMEEEESIDKVDKMLKWCNVMTYHSWRFIRNMTSLTTNGTGYLRHK